MYKWKCIECGDVFTSDSERHSMDYCDCGEAWVDEEDYQIRRNENVRVVKNEQ